MHGPEQQRRIPPTLNRRIGMKRIRLKLNPNESDRFKMDAIADEFFLIKQNQIGNRFNLFEYLDLSNYKVRFRIKEINSDKLKSTGKEIE